MICAHKFDVNDDVMYNGERATVAGLYVIGGDIKYIVEIGGVVLPASIAENELIGLDVNNNVLRFIKETYSFLQRHEEVKGFSISLGPTGILSVDITTNVQGNFDFYIDEFDYDLATEYINRFLD